MQRASPDNARGFTLLEVMVALAIIALALAAALRVAAQSNTDTRELALRTAAGWVADNLLTEQRVLGVWPAPGVTNGSVTQAGFAFVWREEISATPHPLFRRAEVVVTLADGADARPLSQRTGFLVADGAAP